jgi:hypothetical protein
MMKFARMVMAGVAAVAAIGVYAGAAIADNDVGCGVGTQVWEGQKGLLPKLGASCTNGLTFQSISITFGLLNCNGRDTVTADAELRKFAAANIDRLARETARGEGETLEAFASLLGVTESDRPLFGRWAQSHFDELYPHSRTTSGEMLDAMHRLLAESSAPAAS